jgi:hypothetical protein
MQTQIVTTEHPALPPCPSSWGRQHYTEVARLNGDIDRVPLPYVPEATLRCPITGEGYWPLFLLVGAPMSPAALLPQIVAGTAELLDDAKAIADLTWLNDELHLGAASDAYWSVINATYERRNRDARSRLAERMGVDSDNQFPSWDAPMLLTVEEVAGIFRIHPKTVLKQAGQSLPAAIRVGGQYRFRSDGIWNILNQRGAAA